MKKILAIVAVAAALMLAASSQAQIFNIGTTNANLSIDTNWVAVPYGVYDVTDNTWGYGGAVLYQASPYLWTGVRADYINGGKATGGLQAQLQVTETVAGISVTPFVETSVGIGSSTLYGSGGAGAVILIHQWAFNIGTQAFQLSLGAAADYEHVVNNSRNYNQICGGPFVQLKW